MPSAKKPSKTRLLDCMNQPGPLGEQIGNSHALMQRADRRVHRLCERFLPWARRGVAVIGSAARGSRIVNRAHVSAEERTRGAVECACSLVGAQRSPRSLQRPECFQSRDGKQMPMFAKATAPPRSNADRAVHSRDIIDMHMECAQAVIHIAASRCDRPSVDPLVGRTLRWNEGVHRAPHHGALALSASSCPRRMRMRSTGIKVPESMPGQGVRCFAARHA